jgi:hypothetical protein
MSETGLELKSGVLKRPTPVRNAEPLIGTLKSLKELHSWSIRETARMLSNTGAGFFSKSLIDGLLRRTIPLTKKRQHKLKQALIQLTSPSRSSNEVEKRTPDEGLTGPGGFEQ